MSLFIDTAVVMYAGGREHPLREPSRRILEAVADGTLDGVVSTEVIREIFHRFLYMERPDLAVEMAEATLDLFAPVLSVTDAVMRRMPDLVRTHPRLPARDLLHVATCREAGIEAIVSPDRGFDEVAGLYRIDPADAPRLIG